MNEPVIAQTSPFVVQVEADKTYWWCACGKSANQPFCDGSHKASGSTPLKHTPGEAGTAYFCGCKRSAKPPLCDGSHRKLVGLQPSSAV
jgi:CDGSH-type Zn-finger protein